MDTSVNISGIGGTPELTSIGLAPEGQALRGNMSPQMLEMHINQFATQHPQQLAQIRSVIMEAMQTGELSQQELNMIIQLAAVAAQNPEMYPYIRKFAIQQGLATEQDLPQQYDQGLVFVLLLAARAVQADLNNQGAAGVPSMATGGEVPQSNNPDGFVPVNAHEGEYVIPANVVKMKGQEFFDNLIEKYRNA